MGSLVKLGPGCRQNTEHRTQNSELRTATMDSRILFSATALLLLCLVDTGSSIKCHQCNSYDNFHCGDPFYFEDTPDEQKTQKFLADCPQTARNTSAGKSTRTCVVTRGSSEAAGTRRTPRAATATPPCWRSTTLGSAPATRTAATPPACSASPLPC